MGVLLIFSGSCKKDDNNDTNINTSIPVLTTIAITDVTQTTAKSGGNITSDGGATITVRGVCWSTSQTPTLSDNKTTDGTEVGGFISSISGLSANTRYYVSAYATNSNGTGYGRAISFTTRPNTFTDPRDSNIYHTVTIGNQVWMVENLRYLPSVVGPDTSSETTPYYYVYGYNGTSVTDAKANANYKSYGVLYNWVAAQTAVPAGWHLPTDAEWTQLTNYLGGENVAGGKLKETSTIHWISPNEGATNETGFTALPGGRCVYGTFIDLRNDGVWWSASDYIYWCALAREMGYNYSNVNSHIYDREVGASVRCIRD